jgi:hypothetical protein
LNFELAHLQSLTSVHLSGPWLAALEADPWRVFRPKQRDSPASNGLNCAGSRQNPSNFDENVRSPAMHFVCVLFVFNNIPASVDTKKEFFRFVALAEPKSGRWQFVD